jgi:hypothetical protein
MKMNKDFKAIGFTALIVLVVMAIVFRFAPAQARQIVIGA